MRFVQDGDNAAAASFRLALTKHIDLQTFDWCGDTIRGNVVQRGVGFIFPQNVLSEAGWQELRHVYAFVRVCARFAPSDRYTALGVYTRHV